MGRAYRDVSLAARAGEVLGLYGFMGCGQIELVRTLFGKLRPESGVVRLEGQAVTLRNTSMAGRAGIAFLCESRRSMLFYQEPVFKNVTISALERISRFLLKPAKERAIADELVQRLRVKPASVEPLVSALSGGNQQKVALAKWLTYKPKLLVLSEPTRGMDVGAKSDVVKIVRALRDQGMAIIVASTEPETILALADRILVIKKGEISREFASGTVSKNVFSRPREFEGYQWLGTPRIWLNRRAAAARRPSGHGCGTNCGTSPRSSRLLSLVTFFGVASPSFVTGRTCTISSSRCRSRGSWRPA